jgi:hypothetical protein
MNDPVEFQDWATRQMEKFAAGMLECERRIERIERWVRPPFPPDLEDLRESVRLLERSLEEHRHWHQLEKMYPEKVVKDLEGQGCMFRARIRELERQLRVIASYAQAHHDMQDHSQWLHSLTMDIPAMVQRVLRDPSTEG